MSSILDSAALRARFPLLAANPGLHYLDSAASAQKPDVVLDAVRDYYATSYANPHRGAYALSAAATERYHAARATVARFIGARDVDCVLFTRGTTEGMNLLAATAGRQRVAAGDNVVVTALEHHANFVPWQQLALAAGAEFRIAELAADGRVDLDHFAARLDGRTKVVSFGHVSNALGTINPVATMVALVRERAPEAIVVLDGAQSAAHLRVAFDTLGVDAYAFSGHKLGGPMGIGVLVGTRALLEGAPPYMTGGDMIEYVLDDHTTWNVLPHKFEAGTPNAADAVGLAAACDFLDAVGMDAIRAHEVRLTAAASAAMAAIEGVRVLGPAPAERSGVVSFVMDGVHPHDLATILDQGNVCIRAGHHCAQPLMRRLGVPATARASFFLYNDERDVEALVAGVRKAREVFGAVGA